MIRSVLSNFSMNSHVVGPNTKFRFEGRITEAHYAFYQHYGFIHFTGFIDHAQVAQLDSLVDAVRSHVLVNNIKNVYGIPVKTGVDYTGETVVQRLPFSSVYDRRIEEVLLGCGLSIFNDFIGRPDCRVGFEEKDGLVTNYYVNTEGSCYRQMGWHTDVLRDLLLMKPILPMINVGIYLCDSNEGNGGLRVIPCTHTQGLSGMLLRKMQVFDKSIDKQEFLVRAEKGDAVLHDGRLWHRVAKSPHVGEASCRKVMYVPLICGKKERRDHQSKTPFYHSVNNYVSYR